MWRQLFISAQSYSWLKGAQRQAVGLAGRWVSVSTNWCAKSSLYFQKIQCSCSVGCFQYIYIVTQFSITLHAQVTTTWNSSVEVALKVGSVWLWGAFWALLLQGRTPMSCGWAPSSLRKPDIQYCSQLQSLGDAKMRYLMLYIMFVDIGNQYDSACE